MTATIHLSTQKTAPGPRPAPSLRGLAPVSGEAGQDVVLSITRAAERAHYSRDTIYRLYRAGFITGEKQSPRKIVINAASLQAHLEAARDPEFWTPARRTQYWGA